MEEVEVRADRKVGVWGNYGDAGIDNLYLSPGRQLAFRQFITNTGYKVGHSAWVSRVFLVRRMLIIYLFFPMLIETGHKRP